MKKLYKLSLFLLLIFGSKLGFGQAPNLGAASNFTLFTITGDFTNVGESILTGDAGTNAGSLTGFPPGVVVGQIHVQDNATAQAALDVASAYSDLIENTCGSVLGATLGNGQQLGPGVYCIGEASTLTGNLFLDGMDSPDAVFIFKIDGALSAAALSNVVLTGTASVKNVFWQVNGQFQLGNNSVFRGTVIANGAINLLESASLMGRGLSMAGAINLLDNTVVNTASALPVTLTSFTAKKSEVQTALLNWATTAETNSDRFQIERSKNGKIWETLAVVKANGESSLLSTYNYTDIAPVKGSNLYRLKMIDRDESFSFSRIRSIEFANEVRTFMYPNPVAGELNLEAEDMSQIEHVTMINASGKTLFDQSRKDATTISATYDMKRAPAGIYMVRVTRTNGTVELIRIIKE